jgi:pyrroline-5-carboxylate reductase
MKTIGFIGGGNMAESLIGGLLASGREAATLLVSDPEDARLSYLTDKYGITALASNDEVVAQSDVVLIAVKPQVMRDVSLSMAQSVQSKQPLIVSIAAGIRIGDLERWLGGELAVVRVMPNTPALVRAGAAGLYANQRVNEDQRNDAESILRAVGTTVWLDNEEQMDIVTALSGSGPAFFFRIIEALERAATRAGLPADTSRLLAIETALGSARLALEADESPEELRRRVTSPGGTTEAGLGVLESGNIDELFVKTIAAAASRSVELAEELGAD